MDPPIQTEYFLSGGATILIFMEEGAKAVISRCILMEGGNKKMLRKMNFSTVKIDESQREKEMNWKKGAYRSAIPGYIVVPPDKTMFPYKSFRISTSHFMMEL